MKPSSLALFCLASILFAGSPLTSVRAQTPAPAGDSRAAIIVLRHAEDALEWVDKSENPFAGEPASSEKPGKDPWPSKLWAEQVPMWPEYHQPFAFIDNSGTIQGAESNGFEIALHGLSGNWQTAAGKNGTKMKGGKEGPLGEKQAASLGEHLDSFLEKGKFQRVVNVITMDPREPGSTPNPFDTLWPYLKKRGDQASAGGSTGCDLYLVQRDTKSEDRWPGLMNLIDQDKLLPAGGQGSTIICWTGEGLRGGGGILDKLIKKYRGPDTNYSWPSDAIERCADLFVFYIDANGHGAAEKWKFDYSTGEFNLLEKHPKD
jgi:hypothetical protein